MSEPSWRFIRFQKEDLEWAFPVPHLFYLESEGDEIHFHFSEGNITISGENLAVLWGKLLLNPVQKMIVGSTDGYTISDIQPSTC